MNKKFIVLIEDDQALRENTEEILELAGYEVKSAANGMEGLRLLQERIPDIVLCDIMMPELDGYGVLKAMNTRPETACVPFIFLTAKAEQADIRKGMGLGADDYLTKPFEESDLLQSINTRIEKAEKLKGLTATPSFELRKVVTEMAGLAGIQLLRTDGKKRNYKAKDTIYFAGDDAYHLYYLCSGKVKLSTMNDGGKEFISHVVEPGVFFGYLGILENRTQETNAIALEACTIERINNEEFLRILDADREVRAAFLSLIANRAYEQEAKLLSLAYDSVRKRTSNALLELQAISERSLDDLIHVSRQDLASMVGTATESIIRTLSQFKKEGSIEIIGKDIRIKNESQLKSIW